MKRIFLLTLMVLGITLLSACGNTGKLDGVNNIKREDIFNQEENTYFVYFHKLNCADCEQTDPYVMNYQAILEKYDTCAPKRKIYAVLIYSQEENPKLDEYIYREYTGTDGQGTEGKFYVNGVTDWEGLYIGSTSSLISISTTKDGIKKASFVASGNMDVTAALEGQLNKCYN